MRLEPLKVDNLYTGDKPLEFILVPKCPLLRGFAVVAPLVALMVGQDQSLRAKGMNMLHLCPLEARWQVTY